MEYFKNILITLNTIRYLRVKQIYYLTLKRIFRLNFKGREFRYNEFDFFPSFDFKLKPLIPQRSGGNSLIVKNSKFEFTFLNLSHSFDGNIDWNFIGLGKLWLYNLCYFEFLFLPELDFQVGIFLIKNFIANFSKITFGFDPYVISVRNANWIKYLCLHQVKDKLIYQALKYQFDILSKNFEFDLMGNHLIENGFSLLMGAYFMKNHKYYKKGSRIIKHELKSQILKDGGHFEQSPFYHNLILVRLLDLINISRNNSFFSKQKFETNMIKCAARMIQWSKNMEFSDGTYPCFNDSIKNLFPTYKDLICYSKEIEIPIIEFPLNDSGFRMWRKENFEICMDIGDIKASYQPGHSHADTFSFCLQWKNYPTIVDTGISTYEDNSTRLFERGTSAHNTVSICNFDSSEIWGSFRMGRRAKVTVEIDKENFISVSHNGFKRFGCIHHRKFLWVEHSLIIEDEIINYKSPEVAISFIHFHPSCNPVFDGQNIVIKGFNISFSGFHELILEDYNYCESFNKIEIAKVVKGRFGSYSKIQIKEN